jgi:hypothetical protein
VQRRGRQQGRVREHNGKGEQADHVGIQQALWRSKRDSQQEKG